MNIFCWAANFLLLDEAVTSNPYGVVASNAVTFAQTIDVSPRFGIASNALRFSNQVTMHGGRTINKTVTSSFALAGGVFNINPQTASSLLNFYHTASVYTGRGITSSTVSFGQSVSVLLVKPASNNVVFAGFVTVHVEPKLTPSNTISFTGGATCYKSNVINNRFIGIYIPPPSPNPGADDGHCP